MSQETDDLISHYIPHATSSEIHLGVILSMHVVLLVHVLWLKVGP